VLQHLHRLACEQQAGKLSDRECLERFAMQHDEEAFAVLVRRHGPMVRGVCRRVMRRAEDAEDVFQATFLVLARKASSIRWKHSIAPWLYQVAYRLANKGRVEAARRREQQAIGEPAAPTVDEGWREVCGVLDEELHALAKKYRAPLVLCYLQGQTRDEAAERLGWSLGTFKRRLQQARELLRLRMIRRGVTLPTLLLLESLSGNEAEAALSTPAVRSLAQTAMAFASGGTSSGPHLPALGLAEAALRTMSLSAIKRAAYLLLALSLAAGAGLWTCRMLVTEVPQAQPDSLPEAVKDRGERQEAKDERPRTDRYGDPLPPGAVARIGTLRFRHGDSHWSIAFSPDGKTLASGSGCFDPVIRFWDAETGKEQRRIQVLPGPPIVQGGISSIAFSPDGKMLAVGRDFTGWIGFWDAATGRHLQSASGHQQGLTTIAFAPDGKTLASGSYDKTVRIWDTATGKQLLQINGQQASVYSVCFSPDGLSLASGSEDKTIRLWDAKTGAERRCFRGHENTVLSVAFASTGKHLASGSRDKTVRLWDVTTGREIRQMKGHRGDVSAVVFCREDKQLVSGSRDRTVRLWDCADGRQLRQFAGDRIDVHSLAFTPDGRRLAAGSLENGICVWDMADGKELLPFEGHKGWIESLSFLPDGKTLASGGTDATVRLADPRTGKQLQRFDVDGEWVRSLAFSPDGRTFVTAHYANRFALRDTATGAVRHTFVGHTNGVISVAFSPNGRLIASGSQDKTARLWETETGKEIHAFTGHQAEVAALAFSPDGKMLAIGEGFRGQAISLREVKTGKLLRRFAAHDHALASIAFTPDGATVVSGSVDGTIRIWSVATGKELRRMEVRQPQGLHGFNCIALSPDGKFVASAGQDRAIRIWEIATGAEVLCYRGHLGEAYAIAFSPDGRTVASGGRDSTVLVWDATGRTSREKAPPTPLDRKTLETLWADLAGADAAQAYQAIWTLAAAPEQSLSLLRWQLLPVPAVDARRIDELIADLDNDLFAVREKATAELEKLAGVVEAALRQRLHRSPSPEMRRRIERVLEKLENSEDVRQGRAIVILEQIGTSEARQILTSLARGAAEARLTREVKGALQRLTAAGPPR
jgi:RNA polymerase sigma factor (sigma-70 family)